MIPSFSGRGMSALNAPTVSRFTSRFSEGANISHIEPRNSKPISGYTISFFRCCNCFGVSGLAVFFSFFPPPLSSFFPFPVSGGCGIRRLYVLRCRCFFLVLFFHHVKNLWLSYILILLPGGFLLPVSPVCRLPGGSFRSV